MQNNKQMLIRSIYVCKFIRWCTVVQKNVAMLTSQTCEPQRQHGVTTEVGNVKKLTDRALWLIWSQSMTHIPLFHFHWGCSFNICKRKQEISSLGICHFCWKWLRIKRGRKVFTEQLNFTKSFNGNWQHFWISSWIFIHTQDWLPHSFSKLVCLDLGGATIENMESRALWAKDIGRQARLITTQRKSFTIQVLRRRNKGSQPPTYLGVRSKPHRGSTTVHLHHLTEWDDTHKGQSDNGEDWKGLKCGSVCRHLSNFIKEDKT